MQCALVCNTRVMTYTEPTKPYPRTREYGWAPLPVRKSPTLALTLAAFSYLPLLGALALPALIIALTTSGPWEHPVTRHRSNRATTVALISIALNLLAFFLLLLSGALTDIWNAR